ncbi:hypothetical protein D1872_333710 [compost metagenome]
MEMVISTLASRKRNGMLLTVWRRFSRGFWNLSGLMFGSNTTNSSPPKRAMKSVSRKAFCKALATTFNALSPAM